MHYMQTVGEAGGGMSVSRVLLDSSRWRRHSREALRVRLHLSVLRIHFSVTSLGDAADDPETQSYSDGWNRGSTAGLRFEGP